jgi:hypothetical protein
VVKFYHRRTHNDIVILTDLGQCAKSPRRCRLLKKRQPSVKIIAGKLEAAGTVRFSFTKIVHHQKKL